MKKLFMFGLVLILLISFVSATCTVTFDKSEYSPLETVTAEMTCSSATEKSNAYTLTWTYENGTTLETDTGTTPSTTDEHFYESYTIPSTHPIGTFVNATLTGTNLEGTDSANVTSAGADALLITDVIIGGKWLGLTSSISATVKDENSKKISGGACIVSVWSNDETTMLEHVDTYINNGELKISWVPTYESFAQNTDYAVKLLCYCGSDGSNQECIDEDGLSITDSSGSTLSAFTTNTWVSILNAPFPITYKNGTDYPDATIYAGFGEKVYYDTTATNNYAGDVLIRATHFLVNNATGGIYANEKQGIYTRPTGNSTLIIDYEITKEAPTGVYYVKNIFEIYYTNILVAQGIVNSETFDIEGTDDSFKLETVVTDKSNYYTGESVHVCANITNDFDTRVEFDILYNFRCGSSNSNDDTDRSLIGEYTELRALSGGTSQNQCAELPIDYIEHILYKTTQCYASVTVKSPYVNTFDNKVSVTSSEFNVTDYGMSPEYHLNPDYPAISVFPDWQRYDDLFDGVSRSYYRAKVNITDLSESYLDPDNEITNNDWDLYVSFSNNMPNSLDIYNYTVLFSNGTIIDNDFENKIVQHKHVGGDTHTYCSIGIENINLSDTDDDYFEVRVWYEDLTERQIKALESIAGAEQSQRLHSKSAYFDTESLSVSTIVETSLIKTSVNVLQVPAYGERYKVKYDFYARSGLGELVDTVETEITSTGTHDIYFRSDDLNPTSASETYTVYSTVGMLNKDGLWEWFTSTNLGNLLITSLGGVGESGSGGDGSGEAGLYDVIVDVNKNKYEPVDEVSAKITIINMGDIPDEDTIMIYWLTMPNGDKWGETKEQFYEVPPGEKVLEKTIALPNNAELGEWKFNVDYFTVVQPVIQVYDSFEVVEEVTIKDTFSEMLMKVPNYTKMYFEWILVIGGILVIGLFYLYYKS